MTTPEWLKRRGGTVQPGPSGGAWYVLFDGQPQYRLAPIPVRGEFGCAITQTINGKRIPSDGTAENADAAVAAGLKDLGNALGWAG